jgi:hypothetical protein
VSLPSQESMSQELLREEAHPVRSSSSAPSFGVASEPASSSDPNTQQSEYISNEQSTSPNVTSNSNVNESDLTSQVLRSDIKLKSD